MNHVNMRVTGAWDTGELEIITPMCITCRHGKLKDVRICIEFPHGKPINVVRCEEICPKYILDNNYLMSSLLGFVIGDALGVPHEFKSRDELEDDPVFDMDEYGTHHQPRGTWSDDTSLMLAFTEALSEKIYSLDRFALKMCQWFEEGKYTPYGTVFDIGGATYDAIIRLKSGVSPKDSGGKSVYDNGNGGLMRILPAAFYLYFEDDIEKRANLVYEACGVTHNHIISKVASHIYTEFAIKLIKNKNTLEVYKETCDLMNDYYKDKLSEEEKNVFANILSGDIHTRTVDEIKSSGYVIDTLEAVIWCLLNTNNYKDAVLKAVNLGDDTDTVTALTGGLAGLAYGLESIPEKWINCIADKMNVCNIIQRLYRTKFIFRKEKSKKELV